MRTAWVMVLILLVSLTPSLGRDLKRDPDTGVIRVIYVGAPFSCANPYPVLRLDPLLSVTPISGNLFGLPTELVRKAMRLYMPRSKKDMVTKYDVIWLDDTSYVGFPPKTLEWMAEGCKVDGLGLIMGGGPEAFGAGYGFPSWGDTVLADVMPVGVTTETGGYVRNVVTARNDELASRTPWDEYEKHNLFAGHNVVSLRPGSNEISQLVPTMGGAKHSGWTWWDIGEGRFFASPTGFRGPIGSPTIVTSAGVSFIYWKHYPDFVSSIAYFTAGLTPPEDFQLLHLNRLKFREIDDRMRTVAGTIDFISRFGADTSRVDRKLSEAKARLVEAKGYFVDLNLEESRRIADEAIGILEDAYVLALRAKDKALFWIFLTEWLVVTATGLLTGGVVWALMVKRRLYREVSVTRKGERP